MRKHKKKSRGVCVFCGRRRLLTGDHIPPKCLFGQRGSLPSDLITVRACEECNLKACGDDDYLRLALASQLEASAHPVAKSLLKPIIRSLNRPEAVGFARGFVQNVAVIHTFTSSGIYVGRMAAHRIDTARLQRIMDKIIRGLFFKEYGKRIPKTHKVVSVFVNPMRSGLPRDEFEVWRHRVRELLAGGRGRQVGRRVLVYHCNRHPERVFWSVWGLTFYGNLHFAAFTNTSAQLEDARIADV